MVKPEKVLEHSEGRIKGFNSTKSEKYANVSKIYFS